MRAEQEKLKWREGQVGAQAEGRRASASRRRYGQLIPLSRLELLLHCNLLFCLINIAMSDQRTQELGEEDFCGGGEEEVGADKEIGAENDEEVGANKRIKEMSIDRITALPDSLLVRILSSLNTKEAATTSVLSKRWQFLWIDLPCLKFCESSTENEKIRQFVASVNRTLVICNGRDLQKFEVDFSYDRCFASDVNVWVEFAVFNKVRDVSLLLNSSSCEDFYMLPQMMFSNSFIRRLSMRRCTMAPLRSVEWKSLTSLFIEEVELTQHVIEKILSGCPVLSNLLLKACWGFSRLEISQKLCALGVVDREDGKNEPLLEISAPHVDSFIIKHYPKGRHLRLTNIPSLTKTYFDFNGSDWDASSEEAMSNMKHILESIQHVQELELGCRCIEVISMLVVNGWQLPQSRRWGLIVNASSDEHHISGIIALLESSPNLEILVIDGYEPSGASVTLGPATRRDLDCDLLHLKTVQIIIFDLIGEPLLTIAQSLLKRAPILERMIINVEEFMRFTSRGSTSSDFNKLSAAVKIGETLINLLKYPKSSQNAVVLLR